ncbi:hypothetical protein V7S43_014096 [Phytophthora oleae]|uniref:Uncharacterized protein n=1 Tax=Phytophthora oleae TaxID=2107226 RepID=A0ABD3F2P6_9STRA
MWREYLPPKLLQMHVDVISALDQLSDAETADCNADVPLKVLKMMDEEDVFNSKLFMKAQLKKCQDESEQAGITGSL